MIYVPVGNPAALLESAFDIEDASLESECKWIVRLFGCGY